MFWWLSLRNPDFTWSQSAKDYKAVLDVLRRGQGRQYMLARRIFSPTAVLWSANSQRAAYALGTYDDFVKSEAEVLDSLRQAGFDPCFISEEQLLAGELKAKGIKALFLPRTLSLGMGAHPAGSKVWPMIKEFIDQKGVVVTTAAPERDEFLQPLTPPTELSAQAVPWASLQGDLRGELAKRGVKPLVAAKAQDGSPLKTLRTYVHELRSGDRNRGYLVSFLLPPPHAKRTIGADGVPRLETSADAGKPVLCAADCSAVKYAAGYDAQNGKRIEAGDSLVPVEVAAAQGRILSLLPYVVKGVSAQATEGNRALTVTWRINREAEAGGEAEPFAPHVVRIDVVNARTGEANPDLGRNVTSDANGQGEIRIPLSLAEAESQWHVVVTDILTGGQARTERK